MFRSLEGLGDLLGHEERGTNTETHKRLLQELVVTAVTPGP